jgi:hypothetical protein
MAKGESGKSFDEIALALGVTNTYIVQIFLNQVIIKLYVHV